MALTNQFGSGTELTAALLNASSLPVVSSTGDIASPFTGQVIFNTTDSTLYRWTGSAWTVLYQSTFDGGDYTISGALAIGTPTLINNWITWSGGVTPVGISHSSGTFTVTKAGLWDIRMSCRFSNATADKYCFLVPASATTPIKAKSAAGSVANVGTASMLHRFAASGTFRAYAYAGSASNVINETAGDMVTGIQAYRIGN